MSELTRLPNVTASATLTQFAAVKRSADNTVAPITATTDTPIGVAQEPSTTSSTTAPIVFCGQTLVKAGAAINKMSLITIDANGAFIEAVVGNQIFGIALEDIASGASGNAIVDFVNGTYGNPGAGSVKCLTINRGLANIADGDIVTGLTMRGAGRIVAFSATAGTYATTAAKATTLTLSIGGVAVTGGSLALTSANMGAAAEVDASAITAANTFTSTSEIKVIAASTTAFVEGTVNLHIWYI